MVHRHNGCWTCRLRRKKCDGRNPCGDCCSLGIDCCFQIDKPAWLDGGVEQRRKVEETKRQIKANAGQRRALSSGRARPQQRQGAAGSRGRTESRQSSAEQGARSEEGLYTGYALSSDGPSASGASPAVTGPQHTPYRPEPSTPASPGNQSAYAQDHFEAVLLMAYMNYLLPVMYPFYRPGILEGGHCWILPTLNHYSCVRHGTIALVTHILGGLQTADSSATQLCEALDARQLHTQTVAALQSAQQEIMLVRDKEARSILESAKLLCSVVQLLTAEVHLGDSSKVHLDAAVSIFCHLLDRTDHDGDLVEAYEMVIEELGAVFVLQRPDPPLFTPDQASFRFYAASLIFTDCIASTATDTEPQLHQYSTRVLKSRTDGLTSNKLDISAIFGVHNDTILIISSIASLAAWKQKMGATHQLSILELAEKARMLEILLDHHCAGPHADQRPPALPLDILAGRTPLKEHSLEAIQRIWALAARAYLFITTSGPQLSNTRLRSDVAEILELVQSLATREPAQIPTWYRALAWPLCVAGVLVQAVEEKEVLRSVFRDLAPLGAFSTVRRLRETVERVWEERDRPDLAVGADAGFGSLVNGVLLV